MRKEILSNDSVSPLENMDGLTISLKGGMPNEGYVYSEDKSAEVILEEGDLGEMLSLFMNGHHRQLSQHGMYMGMWKKDGKRYIDVVKLAPSEAEAMENAKKHGQLAVYDLQNRKTIYIK
jgi:hypothetical protein